jgi:hypothetical protein
VATNRSSRQDRCRRLGKPGHAKGASETGALVIVLPAGSAGQAGEAGARRPNRPNIERSQSVVRCGDARAGVASVIASLGRQSTDFVSALTCS